MAEILSGAILAAGRGERLRPALGGIPKALVELNGEALLLRQIRTLKMAGAGPIHVIVNSETEALRRRRGFDLPDEVELLVRDTQNSMESLLAIGERLIGERFILLMVDTVLRRSEMRDFVANATKITATANTPLDGVLGVVRWRGDANPLFAQIADDGTIAALGAARSPMVTAGVYLLPTAIYLYGAEARRRGLDALRRFLAMLLEKSMKFAALEVEQAIDLDQSTDLNAVHALLKHDPD